MITDNLNVKKLAEAEIRFPFAPDEFSTPDQGPEFISALISTIITGFIVIGIVAFAIYFLLGTLKWITSGADKAKTQEAQTQIRQAVLGVFVLLLLWTILNLMEAIFGINITNLDLTILNVEA